MFIIRSWVGVEMVGVLVAPGVHGLGVYLEGVGEQGGVRGRVAWCGALSTEAWYEGQSWTQEVALRRAEEEEEGPGRGSDECEEGAGCSGWTPHL